MHKYPKFSDSDYTVPNQADWQGRTDNGEKQARFFQAVQCQSLETLLTSKPLLQPTIALLGFACDEGIRRNLGRVGASGGPKALRQALAQIPLHDHVRNCQLIDIGNIECVNGDLEAAQHHLGEAVNTVLANKVFPIILGGGHETAWGHYLGLCEHVKSKRFAIINFDAHFDMRPQSNHLGTSGTPFLQIAEHRQQQQLPFNYYCLGIKKSSNTQGLFEIAKHWDVKYLTCDQMYDSTEQSTQFIESIIQSHDVLYVSICLDVFASAFAPGVSASSPYGLAPWQVLPLLRQISASKKVIALDVVELSPQYDQHAMTAKLGALCIAEFLYHYEHYLMA